MKLGFFLTMPKNNSWNGKWSGEGQVYAILENVGRSKLSIEAATKIASSGPYYYSFGDGWTAKVEARLVTERKELERIRKLNKGFCGYNWMVNSILDTRTIKTGGSNL